MLTVTDEHRHTYRTGKAGTKLGERRCVTEQWRALSACPGKNQLKTLHWGQDLEQKQQTASGWLDKRDHRRASSIPLLAQLPVPGCAVPTNPICFPCSQKRSPGEMAKPDTTQHQPGQPAEGEQCYRKYSHSSLPSEATDEELKSSAGGIRRRSLSQGLGSCLLVPGRLAQPCSVSLHPTCCGGSATCP